MTSRPRIGWIGAGLMGHGAALNILSGGYPLTVLGHRNRQPVDDLVSRGAREASDPGELAREVDILFLCVPSAVEVDDLVNRRGILEAARPGFVLVDCSTSDPDLTRRIGTALAARGARMADSPFGRTPREAEAGRLSTFVGGDPDTLVRIRPVQECFADTIIATGPLGSGHMMKLLNNFIAIGTACIVGEGLAAAAALGADFKVLQAVLTSTGADSVMLRRFLPWVLEGDDSHLRGPFRIAAKDLRYYADMISAAPAPAFLAKTAGEVLNLVEASGHADRFLPTLPGLLAALYGVSLNPGQAESRNEKETGC
jgi:3-hydroxyisobutyrate dehydrogenase-like beta-hydroxyacid dehydrogenase